MRNNWTGLCNHTDSPGHWLFSKISKLL